jgi:hypothetical protein
MADDKKLTTPPSADESGWTGSLYDTSRQADIDSDDDGGVAGGKTGKVAVRIATGVGGLRRDDLLSPAEMKHLQQVHDNLHKARVDKQKSTRDQRAAIKEGRYTAAMDPRYRQGLGSGGGGASHYKKHPISDKAQFSGIDKQVVGVPSLNEAETNAELKDKLENRLENKYRNTPQFNPRPRPGG